jgi:hypothetical protein
MCKSEKKGKQTCLNYLKLTIVSLLYHTMALCTAYYLDNGGDHRVSLIKIQNSIEIGHLIGNTIGMAYLFVLWNTPLQII